MSWTEREAIGTIYHRCRGRAKATADLLATIFPAH